MTTPKMTSSKCTADMSKLHEIGEIQSCGYLFVVENTGESPDTPADWRIVGVSRNVTTAKWIDASSTSDLRGKNLGYVFRGACLSTVSALLQRHQNVKTTTTDNLSLKVNRNTGDISPTPVKTHGELILPLLKPGNKATGESGDADPGESINQSEVLSCTVSHSNPGLFLIDVETKHGSQRHRADSSSSLLEVANVLEHVPLERSSLESVSALADAFIDMYAYDRVMVYRFAADNSGKVIHESVWPGSGVTSSYQDLQFPATDIPPQARELLRVTGVRFIADTSAPGVPVDLLQEGVGTVDLSMSSLRASSPCHLKYLRNMGVKSSLVVAITVDSHLWGLYR